MKGRFCIKSDDGFWVEVTRDGKVWYMTDPAPIRDSRGRVIENGATSFFGEAAAMAAMERIGLYKRDDPRRFACEVPQAAWEVVPDPNP